MRTIRIFSLVIITICLLVVFPISFVQVTRGEADAANDELSDLNSYLDDFNNRQSDTNGRLNLNSKAQTDGNNSMMNAGNITSNYSVPKN